MTEYKTLAAVIKIEHQIQRLEQELKAARKRLDVANLLGALERQLIDHEMRVHTGEEWDALQAEYAKLVKEGDDLVALGEAFVMR